MSPHFLYALTKALRRHKALTYRIQRNLTNSRHIPKVYLLALSFFLLTGLTMSGCKENEDYDLYSTLVGTVYDFATGTPVKNATVTLTPTGHQALTDTEGRIEFHELDPGDYNVTVQKEGYQPNRRIITAISGETVSFSITLKTISE